MQETGLTKNDKGNILCQKTGTRKTTYLSPLVVFNPEYMARNGWEPVKKIEAPPVIGKSNYSASSYDESANNSALSEMLLQQEKLKLSKTEDQPEIKEEDSNINEPTLSNIGQPEVSNIQPQMEDIPGAPVEKVEPKKRGRKPGTKMPKKVTQPSKNTKPQTKVNP